MQDKKAVGKVYINMRGLIDDYEEKTQKRLSKQDLSIFVIKKGSPKARWTQFGRKTKETSPYELTLTEAFNLARYMDLTFMEFMEKYTKAI